MIFGNALLNVLAIIAIVVIGGLLVYYLGGLLISVYDHKKEEKKETTETKVIVEEKTQQPQQTFLIEQQPQQEPTYEATISDEKFVLDDNEKVEDVDYNKATEEKRQLEGASSDFVAQPAKDTSANDVNDLFNDDKDFDFEDFDFDAFFDEQNKENEKKEEEKLATAVVEEPKVEEKKEVIEEPQVQQFSDEELENLFNDDDFDFEKETERIANQPIVATSNNEIVEAVAEQKPEVITNTFAQTNNNYVSEHTNTTNTIETTKTVYVENHEVEDQLRAEIDGLRNELTEQRKLYEVLKSQSNENQQKWEEEKSSLEVLYQESEKREQETIKIMQEQTSKSQTVLSIEEYQARLEVLRERLKNNEYELKQNRKEFLPLKRVRKNLDKDKAKLRRREALVAKQKVILYGVNNIMEIDPEKSKKLAEDLELLEGLKLSVKHCEEVMEENKERYPILETANRILTTTNNELKQDIHDCEVAILNLRRANGEDVDGIVLEPLILEDVEQPTKRKRGRPRKTDAQKQESAKVEKQEVNVTELKKTFGEDVKTILHSAQTEDAKSVVTPIIVEQVQTTPVVGNTTTTTVTMKKEEITKTHTVSNNQSNVKTEHQFDFDADEPSYEDLFAIENEDLFEDDDDFFDSDKK